MNATDLDPMTEAAMSPPKEHTNPGTAPSCLEEREERLALADEIKAIREEIGEAPDPTAPASQRDGSGIKGTLSRILGALTRLESKVDDLNKSKSVPPPAKTQQALVQKISLWIVIILLAIQQVPAVYAQLRGTASAAVPTLHP